MEITRLAGLLPVLMLTACQGADQPGIVAQNGVPTKWTFNFFTPQALPALVTFAVVQDAGGKVYEFTTLDSTKALYGVIGGWDDLSRTLNGYWNHVERPPRHIIFCWDSVMDKKVYETHLTIPQPVLEKMLRPGVYKGDPGHTGYHNAVQIGLAPEGKVAVWLSGVSRGEPNYRVTPSVLYTLSGDKLFICKGITKSDFSYGYDKDTKDFIKGKVYPYGNW